MCLTAIFTSKSALYNYILSYNKTMVPALLAAGARSMRVASPHPDRPGLRGGARHAGSGLRGHTCVLSMTGSVRVTCGALPARPGGAGLVPGDSGPGTGAVLPNLPARGSNREGPDLGLAALPPGPTCCVLSPMLGQRPLSPGQPLAQQRPLLVVAILCRPVLG